MIVDGCDEVLDKEITIILVCHLKRPCNLLVAESNAGKLLFKPMRVLASLLQVVPNTIIGFWITIQQFLT